SGKAQPAQGLVAAASGVVLWGLYFALGFCAFAKGLEANKLGLLLTVGLPVLACLIHSYGHPMLAALVPPGSVYQPTTTMPAATWLPGPLLAGGIMLLVGRRTLRCCDAGLRQWYDQHQG